MANNKQRVLILGGGFGGVKAALELADNPNFSVVLMSDQANFRYYPSLYHTATGGSQLASAIPLAEIFEGKNVEIIKNNAQKLDRDNKKVKGASGKNYSYDNLIIALGVMTNYFHIKGLDKYSYGIKTLEEVVELKAHLHKLILDEGKPDLNYIIIGGGATGVELAGALPSYINKIMANHGIKSKKVHIDLVEALPRLMPKMSKHYSRALQKRLRKLGVKLYLGQMVKAETADNLVVSDHSLKSHTVVWTAGVTNNPFLAANKFILTDQGKAQVNEYLMAEDNIYVIGDNAETAYSGMAQTALHDAKTVTGNLKRLARGEEPLLYEPRLPVYITPAGPGWAAVQWGNLEIYGWLGWLLRNAADAIGYHDLEPWWKASKHWLAQTETEETCAICKDL